MEFQVHWPWASLSKCNLAILAFGKRRFYVSRLFTWREYLPVGQIRMFTAHGVCASSLTVAVSPGTQGVGETGEVTRYEHDNLKRNGKSEWAGT